MGLVVDHPDNIETAYRRHLRRYVRDIHAVLVENPDAVLTEYELAAIAAYGGISTRIDTYNRRKIISNLRKQYTPAVIETAIVEVISADVSDLLDVARVANIDLITNIGDEQREKIFRALTRNDPEIPLQDDLQKILGGGRNRARVIARDQVGKINATLAKERHRAAGAERYIWRTVGDERVRPDHNAVDGNEYAYGETTGTDTGEEPGQAIQCFTGETKVLSLGAIDRLYRAGFSGKTATIITHSGKSFNATANHPILTPHGWKSASSLNVGDDVVHVQKTSLLAGNVDINQSHSSFFDLFEFFRPLGFKGVIGSGGDFYGDIPKGQNIDIINTKGVLRDRIPANFAYSLREDVLTKTFMGLIPHSAIGNIHLNFIGFCNSPAGIVGGLRYLLSFIVREFTKPIDVGFTAAPNRYSIALKAALNSLSIDPVVIGESYHAISRNISFEHFCAIEIYCIVRDTMRLMISRAPSDFLEISPDSLDIESYNSSAFIQRFSGSVISNDSIKDIFINSFSGHVYSLQTETGLYLADNIVSRNCRCGAEPKFNF